MMQMKKKISEIEMPPCHSGGPRIVSGAGAGIQKNGLDTGVRRHDG